MNNSPSGRETKKIKKKSKSSSTRKECSDEILQRAHAADDRVSILGIFSTLMLLNSFRLCTRSPTVILYQHVRIYVCDSYETYVYFIFIGVTVKMLNTYLMGLCLQKSDNLSLYT